MTNRTTPVSCLLAVMTAMLVCAPLAEYFPRRWQDGLNRESESLSYLDQVAVERSKLLRVGFTRELEPDVPASAEPHDDGDEKTGRQETNDESECNVSTSKVFFGLFDATVKQSDVTEIDMLAELTDDLGIGEVKGRTDCPGPVLPSTLDRMTQEFLRLMRYKPVDVVWLVDQTPSMQDEHPAFRKLVHRIYEQLRSATSSNPAQVRYPVMRTVVAGFGADSLNLTSHPTTDIEGIKAAFDRIPIDPTGVENLCLAIIKSIKNYAPAVVARGRQLVLVVASDEAASDGGQLEEAINLARRFRVPVYVFGRETVFGLPLVQDEAAGTTNNQRRESVRHTGPETAWPDVLQFDGFRRRRDTIPSGFGPYDFVRLALKTGGIFFSWPTNDRGNSAVRDSTDERYFFLDMKEYQPQLVSREEYKQRRNESAFRSAIWDVIVSLDPNQDNKLNLRWSDFPSVGFDRLAAVEQEKIAHATRLLDQAIKKLDAVRPLRSKENSQRWRANFDLTIAQCRTFRLRLIQLAFALDRQKAVAQRPRFADTAWNLAGSKFTLPNEVEFRRLQETLKLDSPFDEFVENLKTERRRCEELLEFVRQEHPGTPWARMAQHELDRGWAFGFQEAVQRKH